MSSQIIFEDTFQSGNYNLAEGATSADGKWKNIYNGFGSSGVHTIQTPSTRTGNCFFLNPQVNQGGTSATLVRTVPSFDNFGWTFYMRTISQHHGASGANWETAWVMFRYTDDTHHYYMYIKKDGGIEIGGKDYVKIGTTQIQTPDGVTRNISDLNPQSQDQQFFLDTSASVGTPVLGTWYKVRLEVVGASIKVWVNDVLKVNIVDNGSTGSWLGSSKTFTPSSQMSTGYNALYVEDALVEYDDMKIAQK